MTAENDSPQSALIDNLKRCFAQTKDDLFEQLELLNMVTFNTDLHQELGHTAHELIIAVNEQAKEDAKAATAEEDAEVAFIIVQESAKLAGIHEANSPEALKIRGDDALPDPNVIQFNHNDDKLEKFFDNLLEKKMTVSEAALSAKLSVDNNPV